MDISDRLYCVKLIDRSPDSDLVPELAGSVWEDWSCWEDREGGANMLVIYAQDPASADENLRLARRFREEWREMGALLDEPESFQLAREDWSEVWKKYFHVIEVAPNLAIKPSWLEYAAPAGCAVVEIDPGMSFGTGQHATTLFCLETLAGMAGREGVSRILDAGCGSGILAIAAAKLGWREIDAFDNDPDAVRIAGENIAANRAEESIRVFEGDAARYEAPEKYDLACVNILGHILAANAPRIVSWVRPGGFLALAGILNAEFDGIAEVFTRLGLEECRRASLREWTSGLFRKPEKG